MWSIHFHPYFCLSLAAFVCFKSMEKSNRPWKMFTLLLLLLWSLSIKTMHHQMLLWKANHEGYQSAATATIFSDDLIGEPVSQLLVLLFHTQNGFLQLRFWGSETSKKDSHLGKWGRWFKYCFEDSNRPSWRRSHHHGRKVWLRIGTHNLFSSFPLTMFFFLQRLASNH